ncbi:MAG: type II secretion system F family protein [Aquificaceae bacterium]|nr:type II secretion system F family protein [Aquificaceae bacterium]MDW8422922.1 type II secretion system F family protein [Aquificaceae bacterium]
MLSLPNSVEEIKRLKLKFYRGVSSQDLSFLLLELYMVLEGGLDLLKALEVVASQTPEKRLREALMKVKASLEKGYSVHRAFYEAGVFPDFFVEMLKVAERGENLKHVIRIAGEYLQKTAETRMKVLTTLTYPSFVILASLLAVFVVVKVVVPKIVSVLQGLGKELPLITKALILFSELLSYILYAFPLLLVLFVLRYRIVGREVWDRYWLYVPIFGKVSLYYNLSRFAGTLLMSLSSGIPITRALTLSVGSFNNAYLRASLRGVEVEVAKGRSMSSVLRDRGVLPDNFVNLLSMGERSGELERSLKMLQELYEHQAERIVSFWLRFVEPIAMLLVGALVAVVVLSVVLPLSEISAGVRR